MEAENKKTLIKIQTGNGVFCIDSHPNQNSYTLYSVFGRQGEAETPTRRCGMTNDSARVLSQKEFSPS